jgi:hypothetical protein
MPKLKRRANGCNGEVAPLSGLLRCGKCNGPMYAKSNASWRVYLCSTYAHSGQCGCCSIPRDKILKVVAEKIRKNVLLGSRDALEREIQKQLNRKHDPSVDTKAKATAKALAELNKQIERAAARILTCDDRDVDDVQKQLRALKQQRDELAAMVDRPARPQMSAKALAAKMWELDRIFTEGSPASVRHALSQLVESVQLNFKEAAPSKRGRRFECVGGTLHLLPQGKTSARSF